MSYLENKFIVVRDTIYRCRRAMAVKKQLSDKMLMGTQLFPAGVTPEDPYTEFEYLFNLDGFGPIMGVFDTAEQAREFAFKTANEAVDTERAASMAAGRS